jgi:hypothetical protein
MLAISRLTFILALELIVLSPVKQREKFLKGFWPNLWKILLQQKNKYESILGRVMLLREQQLGVISQYLQVNLMHCGSLLSSLHNFRIKVVQDFNDCLKKPESRGLIWRFNKELEKAH